MRVSPATVSRKITALETALGATLFKKTTNGYFLTEAGEAMLPLSLETEAQIKLIERHMSHPGGGMAGRVRVDCPELMGTHLIVAELADFHQEYPEITFDFVNSAKTSKLTYSQSDLLIRLRKPDRGNFTMRRVGQLSQALFCSQSYGETYGVPASPDDLGQHRLVGWTEEMAHMPLAQWMSNISNGTEPWVCAPNLSAQLRAVTAGLGIGALPAYVGHQKGLCQVLPDFPVQKSDIWMLRNQSSQELNRVDAVADFLVALFEKHSEMLSGAALSSEQLQCAAAKEHPDRNQDQHQTKNCVL